MVTAAWSMSSSPIASPVGKQNHISLKFPENSQSHQKVSSQKMCFYLSTSFFFWFNAYKAKLTFIVLYILTNTLSRYTTIPLPQKTPLCCPFVVNPQFLIPASQQYILCPTVSSFPACHIKGISRYVAFWIWLLSLSVMHLGFVVYITNLLCISTISAVHVDILMLWYTHVVYINNSCWYTQQKPNFLFWNNCQFKGSCKDISERFWVFFCPISPNSYILCN